MNMNVNHRYTKQIAGSSCKGKGELHPKIIESLIVMPRIDVG